MCSRRRRLITVSKCRLCQHQESMSHLTEFLKSNIKKHGPLNEADRKKRLDVEDTLVMILEDEGLKGIDVTVFGSSATLLGFKNDDVNIALSGENFNDLDPKLNKMDPFSLLYFSADAIKRSGLFKDFQQQFEYSNPQFTFKDKSGIKYVIKANSKPHLQSHELIMKYLAMDERVRQLIMTFKLWAQTIGVCDIDSGGIPTFNLILMVLYFLQQTKPPVIPVIKIEKREDIIVDPTREKKNVITEDKIPSWKSQNKSNLGELWLAFLRFYIGEFSRKALVINITQMTPLSRVHKECSSRRFAIEDPFNLKDKNISRNASGSVMGFFMDGLNISYRYFTQCPHRADSRDSKGDKNKEKNKTDVNKKDDGESRANDDSIKERAEKMVKQLLSSSDDEEDYSDDDVIIEPDSDRSDDKKSTDEQQLTDDTDSEYIKVCDTKEENFVDVAKEIQSTGEVKKEAIMNENDKVNAIAEAMKELDPSLEVSEKDNVHGGEVTPAGVDTDLADKPTEPDRTQDSEQRKTDAPPSNENSKSTKTKSRLLDLEYDKKNFRPKIPVPLFCHECKQDGHARTKCPTAKLNVKPLPEMTKEFMSVVDGVCNYVISNKELKSHEFDQRMEILKDLEHHLKTHYTNECQLKMFGSSVNGFGFSGSDMDVCLVFNTPEAPKNIQPVEVIKKVQKALEKNRNCRKLYSIKTAKVPIVKFSVFLAGKEVEVDISFYNTLALHNSNMLAAYASLDRRVRTLGYCLKIFAKTCNIGDASRASLSSYAYIVMLLYYLQNCNPPVVPVLQELYDTNAGKPKRIVEGWNTWFYHDIQSVKKVWPGFGKNTQTVGELFIGFFRFYTEKFDFKKQVVAMKQSKPLYKHEKSWNGSSIAIEDPFLLKHNLGAGIQKNMFHFIMECFASARSRFGDSTRSLPPSKNEAVLFDDFFSADKLVGNKKLPQNRLCRKCHRIGHAAANCVEKAAIERDRVRTKSETEAAEKSNQDKKDNRDEMPKNNEKESSRKDRRNRSRGENRSTMCFNCRETGHYKAECPLQNRDGDTLRRKEVKKRDPANNESCTPPTPLTPKGQRPQAASSFSSGLGMSPQEINAFFLENMQKNNSGIFPANATFQPPPGIPVVPNAPQFDDKSNDFRFEDFAVCFQQLHQAQYQQNTPQQGQQHRQHTPQQIPPQRQQLLHKQQLLQQCMLLRSVAQHQALLNSNQSPERKAALSLQSPQQSNNLRQQQATLQFMHQNLQQRLNAEKRSGGLYDHEFPQISSNNRRQAPIGTRPSPSLQTVGSTEKPKNRPRHGYQESRNHQQNHRR